MSLHKLKTLRASVSALLRFQAKERLGEEGRLAKESRVQEELEDEIDVLDEAEEEEILEAPEQITAWDNHSMVFEAALGAMDVLKVYSESHGESFLQTISCLRRNQHIGTDLECW